MNAYHRRMNDEGTEIYSSGYTFWNNCKLYILNRIQNGCKSKPESISCNTRNSSMTKIRYIHNFDKIICDVYAFRGQIERIFAIKYI